MWQFFPEIRLLLFFFENSYRENHLISTCWVREADTTRSYYVKNLIFINKRAIINEEKYIEQV
jgi:hypothetical protein